MTTIYILWLRQVKKYLRSRSRMIGSLGQPLLFLFALGFGLGPIFQRAGGGNYLNFLAPGIICQSILFTSIFSGIDLITDRQFGFLKETLVAPVSRFEIILGRTLGGATVATLQGILVLILSTFLGFRPNSLAVFPIAFVFMFLIALLFTALGTAIAAPMTDFHGFQLIINFLIMPLFFLSGALFPLTTAPKFLIIISKFNPLSYGVDGLREILVKMTHFGFAVDVLVLGILTLIILSIASYLFSRLQV